MKSMLQTPGWLDRVGLDAFEYEATRGISASEENLLAFGQKAREHGIRLSLHTQYFISLSGVDPEKRLKSIDYIEKSLWAADLMGADTIVIHSGSAGKISREEAMKLRSIVEMAAVSLDDKTASEGATLFPRLKQDGSLVPAGTRINWNGIIKRAASDLWDTEQNAPDNAPSLWEGIAYREGYRIIPAVITAGTAFAKDECGWWGDKLYESELNGNVYTPELHPDGWTIVK
jgi:sugar phosphate isomerase/epimerase